MILKVASCRLLKLVSCGMTGWSPARLCWLRQATLRTWWRHMSVSCHS